MRFRVVVAVSVLTVGCRHSFTREEALAAIESNEAIHRALEPVTERVAHETVADCRAIYSNNPSEAAIAGDSAWILLSSAGWMDLADVDAPADLHQKKHCRAVLTSKADKTAFTDGGDASKTPWTSYWIAETARARVELFEIPGDSITRNTAVADFQIVQEQTPTGSILHLPRLTESQARIFTTMQTGHFRHSDDGWRLESFEEKK